MSEITDRPGQGARDRSRGSRSVVRGVGWAVVWVALAGYFVWFCTQMAGGAPDGIGGSSLVGILVAVAAGLLAAGLALAIGRRQRS